MSANSFPPLRKAALAIETLAEGKICRTEEIERAVDALNHPPTDARLRRSAHSSLR